MTHGHYNFKRALRLTALYSIAVLAFAPSLVLAFNPNPENTAQTATANNSSKPSHTYSSGSGVSTLRRIEFPPAGTPRQVPVENQTYAIAPASVASTSVAANTASPTTPQYPPTAPNVAKQSESTSQISLPPANIDSVQVARSYVAPAPLPAPTTSTTASVPALPEPIGADPSLASLPKIAFPPLAESASAPVHVSEAPVVKPMSESSKNILSAVPSKLDAAPKVKGGKLNVSRMTPELQSLVTTAPKVESFDAVGLSIKVQRPGLDTNYELNHAYTSLMGGDTSTAIAIYKNILGVESGNQDALFGLAATYHRVGELEKARPYYAQLLKLNPHHREGLNNFLSLVSDESPQEALAELERLEQRNPDFSPIPAQQAILLDKMGFYEQAREKMVRAMELAPENITYKYNLAVMLDRQGRYSDAGQLYRLLIDASLKGEKIPATIESLQKRLNFISTAVGPYSTIGG